MRNVFKVFKFLALSIFVFTCFIACDEEFSTINSNNGVLGENNANFVTDSLELPIAAYNKKLNAVQVNNLPGYLLGVFNQPDYGQTTASIISQVAPEAESMRENFGENPIVESVIINIPYFSTVTGVNTTNKNISFYKLDSLYGNTSNPIKLSIYQNDYFLRDFDQAGNASAVQKYYSKAENLPNPSHNFALDGTQLIDFDANLGALIYEDLEFTYSNQAIELLDNRNADNPTTSYGPPALRIRLDKETDSAKLAFWQRTINDLKNGIVLNNANAFKAYFRGVYFKVEPITNGSNMVLLNLAGKTTSELASTGANFSTAGANITINYTKGLENARTEDSYVLEFSGNRLNTFKNQFNTALLNGDQVNGDETLYLKGMEGSMAVVDLFPTAEALEDFRTQFINSDGTQKKLLNEAQLIINENAELLSNPIDVNGDTFHKYDRIYAFDIASNSVLLDAGIDPSVNRDDPLNSRTFSLGQRSSSGQYVIRVTDYLNNIIQNGSTDYKIGLVLSTNVNIVANSSVLNSNDVIESVPTASIISPRGTILYGSNTSELNNDKRLKLKLFFTQSKEN